MKKVLLISDSHDYLDPRLEKYIAANDYVLHAGDIGSLDYCEKVKAINPSFYAVHGNIDDHLVRSEYKEYLSLDIEGLKILMVHIGMRGFKFYPEVYKEIKKVKPQLFICGHSHILRVKYFKEDGLLHVNPGASGKHGFHQIQTAVQFEIEKGKAQNMEIIELPR